MWRTDTRSPLRPLVLNPNEFGPREIGRSCRFGVVIEPVRECEARKILFGLGEDRGEEGFAVVDQAHIASPPLSPPSVENDDRTSDLTDATTPLIISSRESQAFMSK